MSATATGYLASKPRYEILDGLRGVAALTRRVKLPFRRWLEFWRTVGAY